MPRICFILPKFALENIGGAEQQVFYLAQELRIRGWEIFYIREGSPPYDIEERDGICLYGLPRRRFFFRLLNHFRLGAKMQEIQADVWYCRASKGYTSSVTRHAKSTGGTVVWACAQDRDIIPLEPWAKHPFARLFEKINHEIYIRALPSVDVRLVQHDRQQKDLFKHFGLQSHVLINAHPAPEWRETKREPVVTWVGNMRPVKQPGLFLNLAEQFRSTEVKFVLVGEIYDSRLQSEVEAACVDLPNFDYRGPLPLEDVEALLWRAKVLVNTSVKEGFPNTFIQSWFRGCPVVSLNVDPEDLIQVSSLGAVSGTLEKMKIDLMGILEDESGWVEMSQRCRGFAESYFDIKAYTDAFVELSGQRMHEH